jgi:nucleoside-diphosphate-sugar epimerase
MTHANAMNQEAAAIPILIVGYGDCGQRVAQMLCASPRYAVTAMVRNLAAKQFVASPVTLIDGDLSRRESMPWNTAPIGEFQAPPQWHAVFHFAPPPSVGLVDTHTANLLDALEGNPPARFIYISTTGVYGDCGGKEIDETQPLNPQSDRAKRRVSAETMLQSWCGVRNVVLTILRAPGIYAADRLPLDRIRAGTPALRDEDDVFTNHIHAEDLSRAAVAALARSTSTTFNVVDDSDLKMGAYFDLVADHFGLPRPPRLTRDEAAQKISPAMWSFMRESRRIRNEKMKLPIESGGLGFQLRYATVASFLTTLPSS